MKQRLYLLVAIVMAVISISFTSCGDEPLSELEKQLIGEWDDGPSSLEVFHLKFNSNHTGSFWVTEFGSTQNNKDFKWSVNGNIMTIECDNPYFDDSIENSLFFCLFKKGEFYFKDDKLYLPDADMGAGLVLRRTQ